MKQLLLTVLSILLYTPNFAADVQWTARLEGSGIINGNLVIEDGNFAQLNQNLFSDAKAFSYLRLGFNKRAQQDFQATPLRQNIQVKVEITPYDDMGLAMPLIITTLEMQYYSSSDGNPVLNTSDYRLPDIHHIEVKVTNVTVDGNTVSTLKNYIYLEAGFFAERYRKLDETHIPSISTQMINYGTNGSMIQVSTASAGNNTHEIFLNWDYVPGAETYELEWTWVDNYSDNSITSTRSPAQISMTKLEFKNNSTRIRTTDQHYHIPHIFAKGYLIFRVRGVGRWQNNPTKEKFGAWSSGNNSPTTVANWTYITVTAEHEAPKNWQYQATYAEEGKKKEVTQYFDGSLRGRQTVTRINSDNQAIIGETFYDNQGRGVIQTLPTPINTPSIKYYPLFNQNSNNLPYNHQNFDWQSTLSPTCTPQSADTLKPGTGAAHYYSVNGFDPLSDQPWQQYVPEAHGYPFTQVEYTPDNTGRVRRQSGVGPDHQIGSGHETTHFYLQPHQEELDRLFGYKVGYKSRYKKNIVIDPNGQASASYLDPKGKVIATSLLGEEPINLLPLNSENDPTYHNQTTIGLLNKLNQTDPDTELDDNHRFSTGNYGINKDGLKMETQLGVTGNNVNYTFEYKITPDVFTESCNGQDTFYYPFVYDLQLSLKNDCGEEFFTQTVTQIGINQIGAVTNSATQTIIENPALSQGSYTLSKKLTVNQATLQKYKKYYLSDTNTCLIPSSSFYAQLLSEDCPLSCEACLEALGTFPQFLEQWAIDSLGPNATVNDLAGSSTYYQNIYDQLSAACQEGCEPTNPCETVKRLMLGDVTPGGQYALDNGDPTSIFTNDWWRSSNFISGNTGYPDENGNVALVEAYPMGPGHIIPGSNNLQEHQLAPNGQAPVMIRPWKLNKDDFIASFQPSWAEPLLNYHPELFHYIYVNHICQTEVNLVGSSQTTSLSSDAFDEIIRAEITAYTLAATNPYTVNFLTTQPLYDQDPYFNHNYSGHLINGINYTQLKQDLMLEALTSNYKGTGMSLFKYAVKISLYGNDLNLQIPPETWGSLFGNDAYGNPITAAQRNLIWQKYSFLYLAYKAEINQLLMDFFGFRFGIYNGCIGEGGMSSGIVPGFTHSKYYNPNSSNFPAGYYTSITGSLQSLWNLSSSSPNYPDHFCGPEYDDKIIRVARVDALYNPNNQHLIAQGTLDANYIQWEQTGLCPRTLAMERLLNALSAVDSAGSIIKPGRFRTTTSQTNLPEFTPDLYEAFTGNIVGNFPSLPNMILNGATTPGELAFTTVPNGGNTTATLRFTQLQRANAPNLSWNNYSPTGGNGSWTIFSIKHSYPDPSSDTVTVIALAGENKAVATEYLLKYVILQAADTNFNACQDLQNPQNDPNCDKEERLENDILQLIQNMINNNQLFSTVNITNSPYYLNTTLSEVIGSPIPVYWYFNATTVVVHISDSLGRNSITFDPGFAFFTPNITLISVDIHPRPSGFFHDITFTYTLPDGSVQSYISTLYYRQNYISSELDFSCPCEAENYNNNDIIDIAELMLDSSYLGNGTVLSNSLTNAVMGPDTAYIMNFQRDSNRIVFDLYNKDSCFNIFPYPHAPIIECAGSPCTFEMTFPEGIIPTLSSNIPSAPTTIITSISTHYIGNGNFIIDFYGIPVQLHISCIDAEACDYCTPDGPLQAPISCHDAYELQYKPTVVNLYGANNFLSGSLEEQIFLSEHLVSQEDFCDAAYAYITTAYLYYLNQLGITGPAHPQYLSINEFGNTPLGYSNDLLRDAVDAYTSSFFVYPQTSNYLPWNAYLNQVYMFQHPDICPAIMPDPIINVPEIEENPCNQWGEQTAIVNAVNQHALYLQQAGEAFEAAYIEAAMASVIETFDESHFDKEYHYTLYDYDRAGNLIRTTPPKGVHRFEYNSAGNPFPSNNGDLAATRQAIQQQRLNQPHDTLPGPANARLAPNHTLTTEYSYNSLNQLTFQHSPDGGNVYYAYDKLGRLVVSQNAKQKNHELPGVVTLPNGQTVISPGKAQFSYTLYDFLGRVKESGEFTTIHDLLTFNKNGKLVYVTSGLEFDVNSPDWINLTTFPREEVSHTFYDDINLLTVPVNGGTFNSPNYFNTIAKNLFGDGYSGEHNRNRIVGVIYQDTYNSNSSEYDHGTFYDYDVHGNVKQLLQVHNDDYLIKRNQHFKRMEYDYDLISGNVNTVTYQPGQADQFIHRYHYDADNRITLVETSADGILFEKDAKYFYYEHGPLARTELGEEKVQASDYAYTLQGWLKAVNGEHIDPQTMMGQDGATGTLNAQMGRDAYGFSLKYYDNDYLSANTSMLPNSQTATGSTLYNGNIQFMVTALTNTDENRGTMLSPVQTYMNRYAYDQLHRIKSMHAYECIPGVNINPTGYRSYYDYDPNGNLLALERYADDGTGASVKMDDFVYHYQDPENNYYNNRLTQVEDLAGASVFGHIDIDDSQNPANYAYDAIGQLVWDRDEGIDEIKWKVNNKIDEIRKGNDRIWFEYDAMGNRVAKRTRTNNQLINTYYVLDAQGNPMAIYRYDHQQSTLTLAERNLYGSSRLGQERANQQMGFVPLEVPEFTDLNTIPIMQANAAHCGAPPLLTVSEYNLPNSYNFNYQLTDWNNDGRTDLVIENTGNSSLAPILSSAGYTPYISAHLMVSTTPGKAYKVHYRVLENSAQATDISAYTCNSAFQIRSEITNSPGEYDFVFTAASATTRIKWYSPTPNQIARLVLTDISVEEIETVNFQAIPIVNNTQAYCGASPSFSAAEFTTPQALVFSYFVFDPNLDGISDITINNNATPSTTHLTNTNGYLPYFVGQLMINTIPGETYTLYYDLWPHYGIQPAQPVNTRLRAYNCSQPLPLAEQFITAGGEYSLTFTATSPTTRLEWYNTATGTFTQNLLTHVHIDGPGNILGTATPATAQPYASLHYNGDKRYELANHLGNVLEILTDRKLPIEDANGSGTVDFYTADVVAYSDYYPFGMPMPNRNDLMGAYRYGFQGQEKDNEVKGESNSINYKYRMHDPRLGRFFAVDPLAAQYPHNSPYAFSENRVVDGVELEGREFSKSTTTDPNTGKTKIHVTVKVRVSVSPELTDPELIQSYKSAAQEQFGKVVASASTENIEYSATLVYDDNATIGFTLDGPRDADNMIAGMAIPGYFGVNTGETDGTTTTYFSPTEVGNTVAHEILHQGGVAHPTESNAAADVKLTKDPNGGPNDYKTNSNTVKTIYNNVMLYGLYNVDGKNVGATRGSEENANQASPGQLNKVSTNIDKGKVNGEAMYDE